MGIPWLPYNPDIYSGSRNGAYWRICRIWCAARADVAAAAATDDDVEDDGSGRDGRNDVGSWERKFKGKAEDDFVGVFGEACEGCAWYCAGACCGAWVAGIRGDGGW